MDNEFYANEAVEVKKEAIPLHEAILAWVFLLLGFVFTHLAFRYAGGIWGVIFRTVFALSGAVFFKLKHVRAARSHIVIFAAALVFGSSPIFCANIFLNVLSSVFSFMLYMYLLTVMSGVKPFGGRFVVNLLCSVFERPFISFSKQPECAVSVFRGKKRVSNLLFAAAGLVLSVPLTVIVCALLMSSDDIFESSVNAVLSNLPRISPSLIADIVFAIPVAMYLFGAVMSALRPALVTAEKLPSYRVIPSAAGYMAVTPVCLFYIFYICIQLSRIFGGESLKTAAGYSYFARRGFFELCAIAVIDLGIIVFLNMFMKRLENDKKPTLLKTFTVFICVSTLAIIATALTKMAMYIETFGMTQLRVYTSWFMILLAVVFILIIILQFADIAFWKALFAVFVIMFGALCFGNTDGFIARYNISAYQSGKLEAVDVRELYELGFSAAEPALELYESGYDSEQLRNLFDNIRGSDKYFDKFAYFSVPRAQARKALEKTAGMWYNP